MSTTTPTEKILVTGATGAIGRGLVDELEEGGHPFRVMSRRPEQVDAFRARGIEAVLGDFERPDSVRAASEGCDQLFLLQPSDEGMFAKARAVIDAARQGGIERIVKISSSDAKTDSPVPWAQEHGWADGYLARSGVAWTVLAPSAFMPNLFAVAPAVRRGVLPGTSGHGATTWIHPDDIAAASRAVLTDRTLQGGSGDDGRRYLLTGTQPLSFPQIATTLSEQLGRRVRYLHVPAPLVHLGIRASGGDPWMARGMVAQFAVVVKRGLDGVRVFSNDLTTLTGRPPIDMERFVAANAAAFR